MPLPAASIVDTHTHTQFSDGVGTFEENFRAAADAGCRVIVSTDHLTLPACMDPAGEVHRTLVPYELQEQFAGKVLASFWDTQETV